MSSEMIKQLEQNIEASKKLIETNTALQRLFENRDFKKVILENYFKDESVRLVHLKASPTMQTEQHQKAILGSMDAIGALLQYFTIIEQQARLARRSIDEDEATRDEILEEGVAQ
jgi:hypothetical protein